MSVIKYTAKRNIEPLDSGFSVTGTDISFDTTDDSINSSTTDLSGLSNDDWVKVEGSTSNDGWHQLNTASTSTKIQVDTDLTTESAGDTVTITGYKRGSGEEYSLAIDFRTAEKTHETDKQENVTIGGKLDTLFFNKSYFLNIQTGYVDESDVRQYEEFFESVSGGETFTIDIYGSIGSADNEQSVTLDGEPKETRLGKTKRKAYSFKVRLT